MPPLSKMLLASVTLADVPQGNFSGKVVIYRCALRATPPSASLVPPPLGPASLPRSNQTAGKKSRTEVPYAARVAHGSLWYPSGMGLFSLDVFRVLPVCLPRPTRPHCRHARFHQVERRPFNSSSYEFNDSGGLLVRAWGSG